MNANTRVMHRTRRYLPWLVCVLMSSQSVQAADWRDHVTDSISDFGTTLQNGFDAGMRPINRVVDEGMKPINAALVDPLRTRPDALKKGVVLPGDDAPVTCPADHGSNAAIILPNPLTLNQAIDVAACNNPQLHSAWAAIKVQAAALGEARAAYLPTINGSVSRLRDHTFTPNNRFQRSTTRISNTQYASLSWRLFDFGGRSANNRAAAELLDAAMANHDAALQKAFIEVISGYFDAQTAQAALQSKIQVEGYAQATYDAAQRREAKGAGAQSDTLQAATALSKAKLERSRAQGAERKAQAVLRYALGVPESTQLTLGADLVDNSDQVRQDLNDLLNQTAAAHPAIRAARASLDAARDKVVATRSEGLPSLDLMANYYQNGRPNQGINPTKTQETLAGFTVNLPIFSGFAQTYKIRGAEAQVEQKEADLHDIEHQVMRDVVSAHADAMAAFDNLQYSQNLLTAAQNAVATVQRKFDKGASDILEVLNTQAALSDAEQQRIQCLAEWRSARLRLLASMGMLGRSAV